MFIVLGIAAFDSLLLIISTLIVVIPAWHIPSFKNIENVRFIAYPLGNVAYIGSLYMILISVVKRGPNPRFSPSPPRFSGFGAGMGPRFEKNWGFFGVGDRLNFGVFWG